MHGCLDSDGEAGPPKVSDTDAAAVRADKPMPPQCGLFYYEVAILSKGKEGYVRPRPTECSTSDRA